MKTRKPAGRPRAASPASPARRPRGRPGPDSPDQRKALIDAALACYVQQGIGATSLRDIARQAGVNSALLHYYFGDGAQFLDAVVQERMLPALAQLQQRIAAVPDEDITGTIAAFTGGLMDTVRLHPWLPQLWVREVLCEGGALRELVVSRIGPGVAGPIAARFAAAKQAGRIHADLQPHLLMISLVGLTMFPVAGAAVWRRVFGVPELDLDALGRHAEALLAHGMEPRR